MLYEGNKTGTGSSIFLKLDGRERTSFGSNGDNSSYDIGII